MAVIRHEYTITVCQDCEREPILKSDGRRGGWECSECGHSRLKKIVAVPASQLRGAVEERDRYKAALEELAANKHSFQRPAGAIAKAALEGRELPE